MNWEERLKVFGMNNYLLEHRLAIWLCSACASNSGRPAESQRSSATPVSSHDDSMPRTIIAQV